MTAGAASKVDLKALSGNFRPISEAPSLADLWLQDPTGKFVEEEREKRYLCTDGAGNIYLQMNPAVWPTKIVNGMTFRELPEPKRYDAVTEIQSSPKRVKLF